MHVIALTGVAGSGKDTAAALLQMMTWKITLPKPLSEELLGYLVKDYQDVKFSGLNIDSSGVPVMQHFHIFKFAWPVYQAVGILIGRNPDELMMDPNFKKGIQYRGLTGRQLLQKVGQGIRDIIHPDSWLDTMDRNLSQDIPGAIISDVRYGNEGMFLKERYKATIIKMTGRDDGTAKDHPSEQQVDTIVPDYIVDNIYDYKYLAEQLESICKELNILNCKYTWK